MRNSQKADESGSESYERILRYSVVAR